MFVAKICWRIGLMWLFLTLCFARLNKFWRGFSAFKFFYLLLSQRWFMFLSSWCLLPWAEMRTHKRTTCLLAFLDHSAAVNACVCCWFKINSRRKTSMTVWADFLFRKDVGFLREIVGLYGETFVPKISIASLANRQSLINSIVNAKISIASDKT